MSSSDSQKYRIFSHFWEKGYFLTGGGKFGGDFLVYPGTLVHFAVSPVVFTLYLELFGCFDEVDDIC